MSALTKLQILDSLIKAKQDELDKITKQKRKEISPLVKKREDMVQKLYDFMKTRNLTQYQGVFIKDIAPTRYCEDRSPLTAALFRYFNALSSSFSVP